MPDMPLPGVNIPDPSYSPQVSDADLASLLGYSPAAAQSGPVTSPDQDTGTSSYQPTPAPAPVPGQPLVRQGTNITLGTKTSVSGYNPAAFSAIQAGPHTGVDRQMAADRADEAAQFAPIKQQYDQAGQEAMDATLAAGRLESQKATIAAEAHQRIAAANQDFFTKEQAAAENARAESQTNFAHYKAALLDYNASQVNPSQLWDNAGTAGQFGMVVTAFIHDFLGAKGIQTSGLDSLNTAIKNNISGQLDNMRKKLDVAQGFKSLWEMQRLQSATDAEARARMNGFYLANIQNQIDAQLGSYDSQLALVKAQAAKAAVQQEMAKNDLLVQKHIDDAAQQRATNRVHMYAAELTASSAKYSADAHVKAAEIAAAAKDKPVSPLTGVIFDTSMSGKNLATRRLLPDVPPAEGLKIREQATKVTDTVGNIERLIDLQDQISKAPPDIGIPALKRMQDEERRVAELVRNTTKMGIIYDNSGKQINEQEVKLYDEIVSQKDWFLNGDNVRTLGTLAKMALEKENSLLRGVSTEIVPGDPAYGATSGARGLDPGNQALTDIQSQPGGGRHVNTAAENAMKEITAPKATEDAYEGSTGAAGRAVNYVSRGITGSNLVQPRDVQSGAGVDNQEFSDRKLYTQFLNDNKSALGKDVAESQANPSKSFVGTAKLFNLAKDGDGAAKTMLEKLAAKPPEGDSMVSYYAKWELSQLGK
jgi:hypothetical protein